MRTCAVCGADISLLDGRRKTCPRACAVEHERGRKAAWKKTPAGAAAGERARATEDRAKYLARRAKYRASPKGKATKRAHDWAWQKTEKGRAANRRGLANYYARKRAAGLCAAPGCWEPAPDSARCPACRAAFNAARRAARDRGRAPAIVGAP